MLVYLKQPMAYSSICGQRIYGKYFAYGKFEPTDLPKQTYLEYKDILEEVEYNKQILEKLFDGNFPDIRFKITKIYKLSDEELIELARALNIKYIKNSSLNSREKRALRRTVQNKLTN